MTQPSRLLRDWFVEGVTPLAPPSLEDKRLNISRIAQENYYYCAPASIAMLIKQYNKNISQDLIWANSRKFMLEPAIWFTDPNAVYHYLNDLPASEQARYSDFQFTDFIPAMVKVCDSVIVLRQAVMILVERGRHWVVVVGVKCAYDASDPTSVTLMGLWIADPAIDFDCIMFKPLNEPFSDDYFSNIRLDGKWHGVRVVVALDHSLSIHNVVVPPPPRPSGGGGSIDSDIATKLARQDMAHYGLSSGFHIAAEGEVESSDQIEVSVIGTTQTYFIVMIASGGDKTWVIFEGSTLRSTAMVQGGDIQLPPTGHLLASIVKAKFGDGVEFTESEGFFWAECIELPSKFDTVRILTINGKELYVTSKGNILTTLHAAPGDGMLAG